MVNLVNGKTSHINVDYNNLPIRCRHCLSTEHLVKERPMLLGKDATSGPNHSGVEVAGGAGNVAGTTNGKGPNLEAGQTTRDPREGKEEGRAAGAKEGPRGKLGSTPNSKSMQAKTP